MAYDNNIAFDGRAKSAKELLRQVSASRYSKANPKLVVTPIVSSTAEPPLAAFKFVDGSEVRDIDRLLITMYGWLALLFLFFDGPFLIDNAYSSSFLPLAQKNFDSQEFQVKEILSEVFQHTTNMDNEYEIAGKSIDDA